MVEALLNEIAMRVDYIDPDDTVQTIYFGGGTPSLLPAEDIQRMLDKIFSLYRVNPAAEITLEVNPDDVSEEKLQSWLQAGINRLSMGVQSFHQKDLEWMNRAHDAAQSLQSIKLVQAAGFTNFSIDLIYGLPALSDAEWIDNIQTAINLEIPHLSCYALTVEPKTALHSFIQHHKTADTDPDQQARHFELLLQHVGAAGYRHYEISNFAFPGFESRHNSAYWQGQHYIGIGPSAHSFNGISRQWNVANNALYMQAIQEKKLPAEIETLTPMHQKNEYLMTALRTSEGINLGYLENKWGKEAAAHVQGQAQKHIAAGHATWQDQYLQLTLKGKFLADGIAADLFFD